MLIIIPGGVNRASAHMLLPAHGVVCRGFVAFSFRPCRWIISWGTSRRFGTDSCCGFVIVNCSFFFLIGGGEEEDISPEVF